RMTQEQVFQELVKVARADMTTFATWGPEEVTFRPSSELRPEDTAAVAEVSQTVTEHGGTRRIRLHDKLKALEMLSRYFGMFTDATKEDLTINVNIEGLGEVTKKHEG
ncbi:MAG: terminase small subunit, partial [Desulfotomaculaceae bacterium]